MRREFNLGLIATTPSVIYKVNKTNGRSLEIDNPIHLPPVGEIESIEEPYVKASLILPSEYTGKVMELCTERRGTYVNMEYIDPTRVLLTYELPLSEIIIDFFNQLKAPQKDFFTLKYSAHSPIVEEANRFNAIIKEKILME